jgi:hypothetical protein
MSEKITSFGTRKHLKIPLEYDTDNCEKLCLAEKELIIIRNKASAEKNVAEVSIYDLNLNLKAHDSWDVADINNDGYAEIIAIGRETHPVIKIYNSNLGLISQTSWESQAGLYGTAKCLHISEIDNDGHQEITVISIVEGTKPDEGYVQIRMYDTDLQLKKITRWKYVDGKVGKWGHCLASADIDNDGKDELIALINFECNGTKKADLRILDDKLAIKASSLISESMFATCMTASDVDNDGKTEIIIGGGTFAGRWQGATNQLMVLDNNLNEKSNITWRTFRHSWLWGIQIADVDLDGDQEIITYGGTSLTGKNQEEANTIGEIRIHDSITLETKDMFLWQTSPANDTRPSRDIFIRDSDGNAQFAVATSKWSTKQNTSELEIRFLDYKYQPSTIETYLKFIKACNEEDSETLADFAKPDDKIFAPITLEALALCYDDRSLELMGRFLVTEQPLFQRAVQFLRTSGQKSVEQLRKAGFAIQNDWLIASPFDNTDNKGFDTVYPPEIETSFDAFYAGKGRIVRWGKTEDNIWNDKRYDIYADLAYTHFDDFERTGIEYNWNYRSTKAVAYLLTYVYCLENIEAQFKLGSADGIKVWVNGELKHSADIVRHPNPDQDVFFANLSKGKNTIMLKVTSNSKDTWGYWGFFFRITDLDGRQIKGLDYKQPEITHYHNQMLTHKQLLQLTESDDECLRYLAGIQIASTGDKRGNESLVSLLSASDKDVRVDSALALTLDGDKRGVESLVELAPKKDPLFQFSAGYALERVGDPRSEKFSIYNVKDENGKNFLEMDVENRDYGFYLCPKYKGDDTAHVNVRTNLLFHLGENLSAKCASIMSFGIREPEYRAMGIGRIALKRACDLIAEMGHTCTIVSTGLMLVAHRLYCQCGFFDRRDHWRFEKHLDKLSDSDTDILIRNYADADKDHIQRLREQYMLCTVGPSTWSPRTSYDAERIKVAEHEGKIIGYAEISLNPFEPRAEINFAHVDENLKDKNRALKILLSGIQNYVMSEGKKAIDFYHQPPYMRDILIAEGYKLDSSHMRHEWIGMFRIANLAKFLHEISPLMSLRINGSVNAGWRGSLAIKGTRLRATILFDENGIAGVEDDSNDKADILITADDRIITGLISSNGNVWELYRQNLLTTKPMFNERIRTLIETLFPIMPCRMGGWW